MTKTYTKPEIGLYKMPLIKIAIAFAIGIFISNHFNEILSIHKEFLIFLFGYLIFSCLILKKKILLKSIYWLTIFVILGVLHYHFTNLEYNQKHFSHQNSKILGFRVEDINQTKSGLRILSTIEYAGTHADSLLKTDGKLMVYVKGTNTKFSIGNLVLSRNSAFLEKSNSNPLVFNYKNYLNHRAIYHRMYIDSTDFILTDNHDYTINQQAGKIREKCLSVLQNHLNSDNLAVSAAMILGERKLLDDELYDAFTDTGAVHVLAVSGLHVGIVSTMIFFLFKLLNRNSRYAIYIKVLLSILSVWAFAMLTGMAAAVTRAGIMFTLLLLGQALMRKTSSYNVLACAALVMLTYDPHYLFQAGFQFSFLALIGILYFYKPINKFVTTKYRPINYCWSLIAVSISAQLLVSPLAIFYFHKLPNFFWLTGIVAVPAAYAILTLGLSLLAIHSIFGANHIVTNTTGSILEFIIECFNTFIFSIQKIPYCSADDLWLSKGSLCFIYLALLALAFYLKFKKPKVLILTMTLLLLQSILHVGENIYERKKELVYIYDSYQSSFIDVYKDGHATTYSISQLDQAQMEYINKNNKLSHRIVADTNLNAFDIDTLNNIMSINNNLLMLYPTKDNLKYCMADSLDLVVISSDSYVNVDKFTEQYPIKKVIIDGTFKKNKYWLKREFEKKGIPAHLTSIDGAYLYNLK